MVSLNRLRHGLLLLALLLSGCSNLFFHPMEQHLRTPADIGLEYQQVTFASSDGTLLNGWWLPAEGKAHGSILFLHGNAENISTHIGSVHWLPEKGYNILLFDYRGYGKSEGVPELHGIYRDAEAALRYFDQLPETQGLPRYVFGQSLGASVAIYTIAHSELKSTIDAVIAESAFIGYREIAREKLADFWLTWPFQYPLSWTVTDCYAPIDSVDELSPVPLLLIYSDEDPIIPLRHGRQLFQAAESPKALWTIHSDRHIATFNQPELRRQLLDYVQNPKQQKSRPEE